MPDNFTDRTYGSHVEKLKQLFDRDSALKAAVGGEFLAMGILERSLLVSLGLKSDSHVVDIGCGSGRLACQLSPMKELAYVGTDVVPELLDYAKQLARRPDWDFVRVDDTRIPCGDGVADFVCFFSVFTHLTHEDTFRYLTEARRVLRPAGKIVFSFLEFRIPCHWLIFQGSLENSRKGLHLNQFMDREGINTWAVKLGLEVESITSGDRPHIPLTEEVIWDNGSTMTEFGHLGQSIAVLVFPQAESNAPPDPIAALRVVPAIPGLRSKDAAEKIHDAADAVLSVKPPTARFTNVSTRGYAGNGNDTLILGFVISAGKQWVLARALGPKLRRVFQEDVLEKPWMEIVDHAGRVVAFSPGIWGASEREKARVMQATERVGASPATDRDAALTVELGEGAYSVIVRGHDNSCGSVLVEVFEIPPGFPVDV